jgi:hypothetical protein
MAFKSNQRAMDVMTKSWDLLETLIDVRGRARKNDCWVPCEAAAQDSNRQNSNLYLFTGLPGGLSLGPLTALGD